ncbi:MAG: endolytic transglycosylase MltG [Thermodesulfobacteriota bacterium]
MKRFNFLIVLTVVIGGTVLWDDFSRFLAPPPVKNPTPRVVRILPGMGLKEIAFHLHREGIVSAPYKFMALTWLKGRNNKIQWGDFELSPGLAPTELLTVLSSGKTILKRITIPEGFTLQQIAKRLSDENLIEENTFLASAGDAQFIESLGIDGKTLEGYLFPDTYVFHRGMNSRVIQERMVRRFKEIFSTLQEGGEWPGPGEVKKMVTLASIVEKESGDKSERPLIASVFYNRIRKGMPLQSDPTVIYGIKGFNGDLTKKDLRTPTPYNTYLKPGLPPGPIANPGREALRAVLAPVKSEYIYFVSKNDGSHYFSKNLKDHNRAVARYQPPVKEEYKSFLR